MELYFIILIALSAIVLVLILLIFCTYCFCVDVCFWGDFASFGTREFDSRSGTTKSKYSTKESYRSGYYANSTQTLPSSASLVYQTREDHHSTPLLTKESYHQPESIDKQRKSSYPSKDGFYFPPSPRYEKKVEYSTSTLPHNSSEKRVEHSSERGYPYTSPSITSYIINQSFDEKDGPKNVETMEYQRGVSQHPKKEGNSYYGGPVETLERKETTYHYPYPQPKNTVHGGPPPTNTGTVERIETIYHHPYLENISYHGRPSSNTETVERKETIHHQTYPPENILHSGPRNVGTVERKETIYYPYSENISYGDRPSNNIETVEQKETIYHHPHPQTGNILHRRSPSNNVEKQETIYHHPYPQRGSLSRQEAVELRQTHYPNQPSQTVYYREEVKQGSPPRYEKIQGSPYYHEDQRTLPRHEQRTTKTIEKDYTVASSHAPSKIGGNSSETVYYSQPPVIQSEYHQKESTFRNDTAITNPSGVVQNGSYQNGYSKHSAYPTETKDISSSFARHGSQSSLYDNN